jgi:hypothetical protein
VRSIARVAPEEHVLDAAKRGARGARQRNATAFDLELDAQVTLDSRDRIDHDRRHHGASCSA